MNCDEVLNKLSDYLDQALDAREAAAVEAHLGACSLCRAESDALARSIRAVAELGETEPPANLVRSVMAQVREESEQPTLWSRWFFPLHIKVPVQAMAVLLVSGLAVYLYMTAQRSQVDILNDRNVARAPVTAMDGKEKDRAVAPEETRFAQVPPGDTARAVQDTAEGFRGEVEIAQDSEFAAPPKKGPVSGVYVAKAPKPPERATVPAVPEVRPEAEPKGVLRQEAPAKSQAVPQGNAASSTLEALIDSGRLQGTGTDLGAAWPEATLRRELELLFAPSQGDGEEASTRESLALLVEQLGGQLTEADPAPSGTTLSEKTAPHVFWVSLPENRYDRFRTELSARGIITPPSAPVPPPTASESAAESPWVRIKLTVETR